jgi:DNA (cytosine-5)-methyltransferase 1
MSLASKKPNRNKTMSWEVHDYFCGLGGASEGASQVEGVEVKYAVNHDPTAIKNHSLNFPSTEHDCIDIRNIRKKRYKRAEIGLFSPECKCHSPASGKRKQDLDQIQLSLFEDEKLHERLVAEKKREESRMTMAQVLRMTEMYEYKAIVVENVCEVINWSHYKQWKKELELLGYTLQEIWFNAQFSKVIKGQTPVASSRDRLYIIGWKESLNIHPNLELKPNGYCTFCLEDVHCRQRPKMQNEEFWIKAPSSIVAKKEEAWKQCLGKYRQGYRYFCEQCDQLIEPFKLPAASVIDWTIPAQPIGSRKKPLSTKTLERINKGIERFSKKCTSTRTDNNQSLEIDPFIIQYYGRIDASSAIHSPLPTLTGSPRHALVTPQQSFIIEYYSKGRIRELGEPLGGLTTKERFGLAIEPFQNHTELANWSYRMLAPQETAGAMGFPSIKLGAKKDYIIRGSNTVKHKLIGQAVCPPVMREIVQRIVQALR